MALYVRVLGHVFASRFNGDNNFFFALVFLSRLECFFSLSVLCCLCGALGKLCNITISTQRPATTRATVTATATKTTTSAQQKVIMIIIIKASPCRVGFAAVALVALFPPPPLSFALCVLKPQTPSIRMPLCYVGCCSRCLGHDLIKVLHVLSRFYSLPTSYSLSLHLNPVSPYPTFAPSPPPLPLPTLTGP